MSSVIQRLFKMPETQMQESSTTIIKYLDIDQIISFKKEIDTLDSELWSRHVPENFYTALAVSYTHLTLPTKA